MTLNQIFTEIQYGKEYMKEKALTEAIEKCYDNELDLFYATKRMKEFTSIPLTEAEEQKINRIISKVGIIEERLENGNLMSDAYRKMQTAAVMDDCFALTEEATKSRKVDSRKLEALARIVGATKYFITENLDSGAALKESTNPLFNKYVRDEVADLKKVIEK